MDNPQNPYQTPVSKLEVQEIPQPPNGPYGFWATFGIALLVAFIVVLFSSITAIIWLSAESIKTGEVIDQDNIKLTGDGIAVSTCLGNLAGAAILILFIRNRHGQNRGSYLGFTKFKWWWLLVWSGALYGMLYTHGWASEYFGKEPVVQSTLDMLESTKWMWLLGLAVCVAAPVFEEIFFRGFLYTGWRGNGGVPRILFAMLLSSTIFTVIHGQYFGYDFFWLDLLAIFGLGMLLCAARESSGSIWPPIILHAVNNTLALIMSAQHLTEAAAG